jgi:hypothetical protein
LAKRRLLREVRFEQGGGLEEAKAARSFDGGVRSREEEDGGGETALSMDRHLAGRAWGEAV